MRKLHVMFFVFAIIVFVVGFLLVVSTKAQTCPIMLEHKGAKISLGGEEIKITKVELSFNNPRFFSPGGVNCSDIKLFRKNANSPIVLMYKRYGPILKFWPKEPLRDEEDYVLMVNVESYPIRISVPPKKR